MKIINNKNDFYNLIYLAHGLGFEPRKAVLETAMLPITSSMYENGTPSGTRTQHPRLERAVS